ncbi:MAG: prenyltransferase/squalene oxidase repeat-containing protein [Rubripirellula sp.]
MNFRFMFLIGAAALQSGLLWAQGEASNTRLLFREQLQESIGLLEAASIGTADERKCFTCHGQALPIAIAAEARLRGFQVDERNIQRQVEHTLAHLKRGKKNYLIGKGQGGKVDTAGYALWGLEAGGHPPDEITSAVTEYLLKTERFVGHWKHGSNRPPSESSDVTSTYVALRALGAYGTNMQQERIGTHTAAASDWLMNCKTRDTEDRVFQLRGLAYLGKSEPRQQELADELIARQREDGGWAQTSEMTSDAYATGTVLTCLSRTGHLQAADQAYQRGIDFLMQSRQEDGSWHVVSRSVPFQAYFESGFPHGEDQFISTTATAWAVMAMLLSLDESKKAMPGEG